MHLNWFNNANLIFWIIQYVARRVLLGTSPQKSCRIEWKLSTGLVPAFSCSCTENFFSRQLANKNGLKCQSATNGHKLQRILSNGSNVLKINAVRCHSPQIIDPVPCETLVDLKMIWITEPVCALNALRRDIHSHCAPFLHYILRLSNDRSEDCQTPHPNNQWLLWAQLSIYYIYGYKWTIWCTAVLTETTGTSIHCSLRILSDTADSCSTDTTLWSRPVITCCDLLESKYLMIIGNEEHISDHIAISIPIDSTLHSDDSSFHSISAPISCSSIQLKHQPERPLYRLTWWTLLFSDNLTVSLWVSIRKNNRLRYVHFGRFQSIDWEWFQCRSVKMSENTVYSLATSHVLF